MVATETGMEIEVSPLPTLPAPHAPWAQREPVLRRYAMWLTRNCGLTQAAAASVPQSHGTPHPTGLPVATGDRVCAA